MAKTPCMNCSQYHRDVFHEKGEKCPTKAKREKAKKEASMTRADKAEKLIASVDKSIAKAKKRLRHGETLLIDLEDRAKRRQDRRQNRNRRGGRR